MRKKIKKVELGTLKEIGIIGAKYRGGKDEYEKENGIYFN